MIIIFILLIYSSTSSSILFIKAYNIKLSIFISRNNLNTRIKNENSNGILYNVRA